MTRKKQKTSGKGESASIHRWADEVIAITENPKQRGIEIRFNAEPSPQLQPKLRAMSFRHSKMKTMWYGDSTPEALEFAEKVKAALPTSTDGPDLFLSPSVEAVRTNIENREFSFVMITLTDGQVKNYIIFEASKPKAEVIASNFARQEFGDTFLSLAALPKTHIKEARTLFDEGKIIYPEGQKVPTHKASIIKGLNQKSSELSEENYETEGDKKREVENLALQKFYKWATLQPALASKPSQVSREMFDNWLKENYPQLSSSSIENMWRSHERIIKSFKRYEKRSTGKPLAQPYSAIYKKLLQIIPDLIKHIEDGKDSGKSVKDPEGGLMNLNFDYLGKDKKGNYLIALSHLFEQNGDMVPDPDMQIRILPQMEMAEAMTFQDQYGYQEVYPDKGDGKEYVDLRRKKELNQFLSQWLTNIIKQGHKIDLTQEESETEADENSAYSSQDTSFTSKAKENPKPEFERLHTPEEEKEIIEQFLAQGFTRPFSAQEAFDKNLPVIDLAFRYVESMEYFRDHIENPRKEKIQELRKELKDLKGEKGLNEKKNSLKEQIEQLEAEMTFAEKLVQDESLIFQDDLFAIILKKGKQRGYAREIEDDISSFRDYVVTNILDNRAIENYHKDPVQIVVNELIDEYFNTKEEKTTPDMKPSKLTAPAFAEDLKTGDTFLPNVLVPAGTKEPFLAQNFQLYDMKSVVKTNFPHLLKINEKNLSKASAIEMFELMQMGHPSEYGIDVNRITLLKEWEEKGKEYFEELGFPTDTIYPYVNLHLGYESIEPLGEILFDNNKEGNEWWAVAEHCRPIADAGKALEIIQHQIQKQKNEKKGLISPKTNKPKLEYKQLAQDIDHTVENLEDSKEVIQHYIDNPLETSHSKKVEKKSKDPLTNDSGVYTEKTAGKNYEKIVIPMPKAAQYEAVIKIVKTSDNDYKIGIDASKKFGDYNGMMYGPSEDGQPYASREAALKGALKEHELKLELLLIAKDSSLGNEEKKIKNLTAALEAVRDFAEENGIVLNTPKAPNEEVLLKEIYLSAKENYSKALVVNTWKEANDFIRNKKWNNDTVYFKVVWKDGETFERKLDYINTQLYEKKLNPLSDFVYQYNLTVSQMKPLKGSALNDPEIVSKAKKLAEGYSYSDKKSSAKEVAIGSDEIMPVPGIDIGFGHLSTAGDRHRISEETHKKIGKSLQNAKTDLFYYKDAAWTIVKSSTPAILELPEMTSNAKSYYEQVYKTSDAYLKKQDKETGIIKGLEATYWTEEDNKYPQNKVLVNGMTIQQARLRDAITNKLEKLPLPTLLAITDELSKKFKERKPLDTYEKGYVTIGKTGDKRKAALIAIYIDNMIVDNDLAGMPGIPVMSFLVKLLYDDSQKFVDLPQNIEKQAPSKMKKQSQHELNKEIEAFIEKQDKEGRSFNEEEKNYIRQYTGSGGLIKEGAAGRGVLYEYYTPDVVVQKMWGMAFKYGYDGGSVLEPSVGTGNFLKYAPKDAIVFGFETNHYSARIAQILYPNAHIHEKSFESLFFAGNIHLKDDFDHPPYSLVIGNPPYGDFTGKYAGMGEKQWTGATEYDQYFILRGLDLLKKGGLLVFVVPSSFLSYNVKSAKVKEKIASKVDFMDAYRLPIRTFETTDIGTDILLLRKK